MQERLHRSAGPHWGPERRELELEPLYPVNHLVFGVERILWHISRSLQQVVLSLAQTTHPNQGITPNRTPGRKRIQGACMREREARGQTGG